MRINRSLLLSLLFTFCAFPSFAQQEEPKEVDFEADYIRPAMVGDSSVYTLIGNVIFHHNGAVITCDSAVRYSDRRMECFDRVVINQNTTFIYGDRADYDGDINLARVYAPIIKMVDEDAVLHTYNFSFNTLDKIGIYSGGGTIEQGDNLLESIRGYYYADKREFICVEQVELTNPDYMMKSDSAAYNLDTEIASFFTKSIIWNSKGEILSAERGRYDTKSAEYFFTREAYIMTEIREVWADTIDYNSNTEDAILRTDVQIRDEEQSVMGFGDYGIYWGQSEDALLTKNPSLISFDPEQDTLYMRADSIFFHTLPMDYDFGNSPVIEVTDTGEERIGGQPSGKSPGTPAMDSVRYVEEIKYDSIFDPETGDFSHVKADTIYAWRLVPPPDLVGASDSIRYIEDIRYDSVFDPETGDFSHVVADTLYAYKPAPPLEFTGAAEPERYIEEIRFDSIFDPDTGEFSHEVADTIYGYRPPPVPELLPGTARDSSAVIEDIRYDSVFDPDTGMFSYMVADTIYSHRPALSERMSEDFPDAEVSPEGIVTLSPDKTLLSEEMEAAEDDHQADFLDAMYEAIDSNPVTKGDKKRLKAEQKKIEQEKKQAEKEAKRAQRDEKRRERYRSATGGQGEIGDSIDMPLTDSMLMALTEQEIADSLAAAGSPELPMDGEILPAEPEDSIQRFIRAFYNVRIYRNDFQAVSDSLTAFSKDSTLHMYIDPILWNENNQITSDVVDVYTKNEELYKAVFTGGDPMMIGEVDTAHYNQIKGKIIEAYFRDNDIFRTDVNGNAQTYYYMQDEDTGELQTFLTVESADASFYIEDQQMDKITYRGSPVYFMYPMDKIPADQELFLPGFEWHIDKRPELIDVHNRPIRPTQREEYESMEYPLFPLTDKILNHKKQLIDARIMVDRNDTLTPQALEFLRLLENEKNQ